MKNSILRQAQDCTEQSRSTKLQSKIQNYLILHFALLSFNSRQRRAGFTLIELIIVMVILGILATVFVSQFPASLGRSRDTRRLSDIKQYQTAFESYANRNNAIYPIQQPSAAQPSTFCATLGLTSCPVDPKDGTSSCSGGTCRYQYVTNTTGTTYGLWARLERPFPTTLIYFISCSNGKSGQGSVAPTSANTCPI